MDGPLSTQRLDNGRHSLSFTGEWQSPSVFFFSDPLFSEIHIIFDLAPSWELAYHIVEFYNSLLSGVSFFVSGSTVDCK